MLSTPLRSSLDALATHANADLALLWRRVESAAQAREALNDLLPSVVDRYGKAAAVLAAQWYDDLRAKQGVGGSFRADPANIPDTGVYALVGWAETESASYESFQGMILGGTQKRIANFARATVQEASAADSQAIGWQREGKGSCAFCQMLIARGVVFSKGTVTFGSHEHCQCVAVPAFGGRPVPVRPYTPSSRNITDADRARVRDWIRANQ